MFCGVTNEEFKKISSTEIAKEAWTIIETTNEGTKAIKTMKLHKLTSSFEEIRIEEDETFDEFYAKLGYCEFYLQPWRIYSRIQNCLKNS